MNFCDINPFIRFAELVFHQKLPKKPLYVQDCRILYCISGSADIFIENEHFKLIPNSLFYCASGKIYTMQTNGLKMIALNFDLTQENNTHMDFYPRISIENNLSLPVVTQANVADCDFLNSHLFINNSNEHLALIQEILNEFSSQRIHYRENGSAMLKILLINLYRYSIAGTPTSASTVSQIMDYIKNNYNQPLTNKMLSSMSGYHEYHLNRLFMKQVGMSVHKYVLNIRINEAKRLLLTTDDSLAAIAEKVGFNSNTHFSTYFKQVIGTSPLEFQKQFKNNM